MIRPRSPLVAVVLLAGAADLAAQDHTLGLNLRLLGTTQVGVTWFVSPSVALRPSLEAGWAKTTSPFGGSNETTQWALNLEALFGAGGPERVNLYTGVGGSIGGFKSGGNPASTVWSGWGLIGARLTVVDRVALFGEVGVIYEDSDDFGPQRVQLGTFPLGIVVFLN